MDRVSCPHCGFLNFSISAYCGRCERILPRTAGAAVPTPVVFGPPAAAQHRAPAAVPPESRPLPPPLPTLPPLPPASAVATHATAPTVATAFVLPAARAGLAVPTTPMSAVPASVVAAQAFVAPPSASSFTSRAPSVSNVSQASVGPGGSAAIAPLTSVPAPLPPLSLEAPPPPVQPFELDRRQGKRRRPAGPDIGDLALDPDGEVPVEVASVARVFLARLIDSVVALGVGAVVLLAESLVSGAPWGALSLSSTVASSDGLAEWARAIGAGGTHGAMAAALGAVVHSTLGAARSGQTLGRKLTNTVLVRRDGKPWVLWAAAVRAVLGLASMACAGIGLFWPLVDSYHRTWHDLCVGSVTVRRYVRRHSVATTVDGGAHGPL